MKSAFGSLLAAAALLLGTLSRAEPMSAQAIEVPFDSSRWTFNAPHAEFVNYLGRPSVRLGGGSALVKDMQLQDGTIEASTQYRPS